MLAPVDPPGPNPWVGSGTGTTTVIDDGTDGSPEFSYDHEVECCATGTWEFSTEASEAGTIDLDWTYSGYHAWFQVTTGLTAFVRTEGGDANTPLVSAGPTNCCDGPPSGGFSYSGSTQLTVQAGDVYGFKMSGSNGNSDGRLNGNLKINGVTPVATDRPTLIGAITLPSNHAYVIGIIDGAVSLPVTLEQYV